jgi:cytochrome c-type biogenesis protein CcmH/NrfG
MPAYNKKFWVLFIFSVLIVSLSFLNLYAYFDKLEPSKNFNGVLGAKTEVNDPNAKLRFWQDFLADNPNYFPGWIELLKIGIDQNNKDLIQISTYHATRLEPNSYILKKYLEILSSK